VGVGRSFGGLQEKRKGTQAWRAEDSEAHNPLPLPPTALLCCHVPAFQRYLEQCLSQVTRAGALDETLAGLASAGQQPQPPEQTQRGTDTLSVGGAASPGQPNTSHTGVGECRWEGAGENEDSVLWWRRGKGGRLIRPTWRAWALLQC